MFRFEGARSGGLGRQVLSSSAMVTFILILCAAVLGHDMVRTWEARSHLIKQSQREVENLTSSASQQAREAFGLASTILTGFVERVETDGTGPEQLERLRRLMMLQQAASPMLEDLVLTDAAGITVVDGRLVTPRIDISDREYFQFLRSHYNHQPYIGIPVQSKLTGRWIMPIGQRVFNPDDSFAGIVIATLDLRYFKDFYATFKLGHDGAAALWRDDGILVARQAWIPSIVDGGTENGSLFRAEFPDAASGTFEVASRLDGLTKVLSYRRIAGYPLVVAITLGKDEQLADWRAAAVEHLLGAVVLTIVLGFLVFRLVKQARYSSEADRVNAIIAATAGATAESNEKLDRLARHLAKARDRAEQASRAKSRFLAGMSHELRTPLNGILGYAELLQREGGLNAAQSARLNAMQGAGKHLLQMIAGVLDLSEIETEHVKLQAVTFELQSVAAACLDLIRPTAEAKGLTLSMTIAPATPKEIVADPTRLRQVLLNLLGNAAKFTIRGAIELRLEPTVDGSILLIKVVDTGPGIPPGQRQRLFQEFERLQVEANCLIEGAGIGLALSVRLAVLMGGRLGHDDNPGGGSVFWLEIPLTVQATSVPASTLIIDEGDARQAPSAMRALHVLVVDDMQMNRDIAASFLRAAGHKVTCAEDGVEAVAAATYTEFDVVLMDVRMPGMDGLEATRHIRALGGARGQVPIVALTAQAFTDQVELCRKAGMDSHLGKPFDMDTLLAAVTAIVGVKHRPYAEPLLSSSSSSVPADAAIPSMEQQLPVLDTAIFQRTASFLTPEAVASHMQTIEKLGKLVLCRLSEADALPRSSNELATAAHTLAGSAGMFGFTRLAATGRSFEHAVQSQADKAPALANELRVAVEATLREIRTSDVMSTEEL